MDFFKGNINFKNIKSMTQGVVHRENNRTKKSYSIYEHWSIIYIDKWGLKESQQINNTFLLIIVYT